MLWLLLGATGLTRRLACWVPNPVLLGMVMMGVGFSFMLEGIRMMAERPWIGGPLLVLLARSRFPAMVALLVIGAALALVEQLSLAGGWRPSSSRPACRR